jgi:hypothetical protein
LKVNQSADVLSMNIEKVFQHTVRKDAEEIQMKRQVIAIVAVVVFAAFVQQAGAVIVAPAGYWQFDDNTNRGKDTSGNNRDVTIHSDATAPITFSSGLIGDAMNTNTSPLNNGSRADSTFNIPANFTVQTWAKFDTVNGEQVLVEKFTSASGPGWTFYKRSDNGIDFYASASGSAGSAANVVGVDDDNNSGTPNVTDNLWHQFVARRTGNTLQIFFDGTSVASSTLAAGTLSFSGNDFRINSRVGLAVPVMGSLDEVAVWNTSLSDSDITTLYNGRAGLDINSALPEPTSFGLLAACAFGFLTRRRAK